MRVTSKGQVTIPQRIREKLGITANSEVDFIEEGGRVVLRKVKSSRTLSDRIERVRRVATVAMTTEEIMRLTRGD